MDSINRREFMKVMGFSAVSAGVLALTSCQVYSGFRKPTARIARIGRPLKGPASSCLSVPPKKRGVELATVGRAA